MDLKTLLLEHQRRDSQVEEIRREMGVLHNRIVELEQENFDWGDPKLMQRVGQGKA